MAFGSILFSYSSPALNPAGITFDGKNLLVGCNGDSKIHEVDRPSGKDVRSFSYITSNIGLGCDGKNLFQSNGAAIMIVTDKLGNEVKRFTLNQYVYGFAVLGGGIIVTPAWNGAISKNAYLYFYELETGKYIRRVNTGYNLGGLCFDGKVIYGAGYSDNKIFMLDLDGSLINSVSTTERPLGIAFDGKNLWVANDTTDKIYCMSRN